MDNPCEAGASPPRSSRLKIETSIGAGGHDQLSKAAITATCTATTSTGRSSEAARSERSHGFFSIATIVFNTIAFDLSFDTTALSLLPRARPLAQR